MRTSNEEDTNNWRWRKYKRIFKNKFKKKYLNNRYFFFLILCRLFDKNKLKYSLLIKIYKENGADKMLEKINSPEDIKKLSLNEKEELAQEIRKNYMGCWSSKLCT